MPRTETGLRVEKLFRQQGPLTVGEAAARLGLPNETVRRHVRPPFYRRVECEWATRRWEWRWAWVVERCDCGAPAWYMGRALMHFDKTSRVELFWLCGECARLADDQMAVERRWPTGSK